MEEIPLKELEKLCQEIGKVIGFHIDKAFGKGRAGFCLLLFDFGEPPGNTTYICNANREDMLKILKQFETLLQSGAKGVILKQ